MQIFLDSRDLIDLVEHRRPTTPSDFGDYLRAGNHSIVLSFTNVRELVRPLAKGTEFLQVRPLLQSLERMPHTYVKEVTIVAVEIQSAVDSFNAGTEYQPCSPFVSRWDRTLMTLPGGRVSIADRLVGLRLDEIVYYMYRVDPQLFAPPGRYLPALQALLEEDRSLLRKGQAPARKHFVRSIRKHAASHHVSLPNGREDEFGEWVYRNPDRCPGLRLNHEVYRALTANYTDVPETADFSDLAHVFAIPYVDAATLDNRMRNYCRIASRKIVRMGGTINYGDRLRRNITDLTGGPV